MSVYQMCFDLIHTYIYGGAVLSSDMSLVCTTIATISCLFVFVIPFFVILKILKLVLGF